jgi:hypothetical protein
MTHAREMGAYSLVEVFNSERIFDIVPAWTFLAVSMTAM